MAATQQAFFLDTGPGRTGQRFCIHHWPQHGQVRGAVVCVQPFAEEINKVRRMAALQSRALAAAGFAVLQIDLLGCGDSSGDFGDASWSDWLDDLELAARWLRQRHDVPLWWWGTRAGCLLAVHAAARLEPPAGFMFWQPATSGKPALQQFLRMKAAAALQQADAKGTTERLRQALAQGQSIEVGGYVVRAELAHGLEAATLDAPLGAPVRAHWFELSNRPDAALLPASVETIERWRAAGHEVDATVVPGPAFWGTAEIEEAPALVGATCRALLGPCAA